MEAESSKEVDKGLKLLAKSSVIVLVGVILSKIFSYAHRIIIAKTFGPEVYGLFSLAIIIFNFFVYFASLGLNEGVLRYISIYRGKEEFNKAKYILKFSTYLLIISGLFSSILLFLLSKYISINIFHNENLIIFLRILSFAIIINVFANIYLSVLRAFEKISWYSFILNILQNFMKFASILILIFIGVNSNSVIFSFVIGIISMFIVSYYLCKTKLPIIFEKYKLDKDIKKQLKKNLIFYSFPVMFSSILVTLFYWIDSFAIGYFKDATNVGFYNAAIPIVLLFGIATDLFMQLFYPLILKEFSKNNFNVIKELSQQVGKWVLMINIPLFIIMFFFPGEIINLFFGHEYIVAEKALKILAVGGFISIFTGLLTQMILMAGKSKWVFFNLLGTSILNLILNAILIPKYGLQGAAFATTISWISLTIILFVEAKSSLNIIPLRLKMIRIILVSIIPIFLVFILKENLPMSFLLMILLIIFFILSYFCLILITRCFDRNDLMILRAFKNKIFRDKINT